MKHRDLIWWSYAFQWSSLGTAFAMCMSLLPPIDGSDSRFPLTIYIGIAAMVFAVLSIASIAVYVLRHRGGRRERTIVT